jgi:hypothetical protein
VRVEEDEVIPGLVVHLDTTVLRQRGDASTNAELAATGDRAVQGPHYFLVVDVSSGTVTALPLFSKQSPGSQLLDEKLKFGLADKWIGVSSYISKFQHWRFPTAAMPDASVSDEATPTTRRMYAGKRPAELARLGALEAGNRAKYRAL